MEHTNVNIKSAEKGVGSVDLSNEREWTAHICSDDRKWKKKNFPFVSGIFIDLTVLFLHIQMEARCLSHSKNLKVRLS